MKALVRSVSVLGILLILVGFARSGEEKDLRAIIDKAIVATGGAKKLARFQSLSMKAEGKIFILGGDGLPFTGEWHVDSYKQIRFGMDLSIMGQNVNVTVVVTGDKGWIKAANEVKDMTADELAEQKENMYAEWATSLLPLKDKAFQLSALGETKVEARAAVGVRVSKKGHRDLNLYFDKADGILLKSETMVKDVQGGGNKEMNQESFYSEYKEADGVKHPSKLTIKRDGNAFLTCTFSEFRPHEKLDKSLFERP